MVKHQNSAHKYSNYVNESKLSRNLKKNFLKVKIFLSGGGKMNIFFVCQNFVKIQRPKATKRCQIQKKLFLEYYFIL